MMRLPNNLRSERVRAGLSAEQVATYAEVSPNTIRSWERGATEPPISKIQMLSRLYHCTLDYLLGMTDERVTA